MGERVLITGGAGFVGSHLADALAAAGHEVILFDTLEPQVHGQLAAGRRPAYLDPAHRLEVGDVRDASALARVLPGVDVVFHLAAAVGVGQSMYEIRRYTDVNAMGMATLLEALIEHRGSVRKLLVASSMSIYGEGAYVCAEHGRVAPRLRPIEQLRADQWEVRCPRCGAELRPVPTDEDKPLYPTSIYAITKRDHEEMALAFGHAYRLPTVALRFFNIYGSRQALTNPYTGIAAIFCGRMLAAQPPVIYEDGRQQRDLVHISDIVRACQLAMANPAADNQVLNVGTGRPTTVLEVAEILADALDWRGGFQITGQFRAGDIRHCFADLSRVRELIGYEPRQTFRHGVRELVRWVADQQGVAERLPDATGQLVAHGLVQ